NLSYVISDKERLIRPELAGGALLDVGIYCLNFALMHFGKDIDHIDSSVQMTETGVDGQETITIFYKDGRMASLYSGIYSRTDRRGMIHGDRGYIEVDNINNPQVIRVYNTGDECIQTINAPAQINGYEYELIEAMNQVQAGEVESVSMPLDETIECLEIMDGIRAKWNMVYPMEL
ncbi:MAG: gfo/Idh/MocA family oxidoreductase, partial [Lachnospiraceae bacterium]|nr:gfo/Idh/MocA family oxidoreductase [Candidatus Merdinaster equi]